MSDSKVPASHPEEVAFTDTLRVKRVLWSSNRDEPDDYYADTLKLLYDGDGRWCLELSVGGWVTRQRIVNIEKYL